MTHFPAFTRLFITFADDNLLLVAAGELAHNLVDGGGLDAQGLNVSLAALLNLLLVQEHAGGMPLEAGKNQIGADGLGQHRDISPALPQGRHADLEGGQAVE